MLSDREQVNAELRAVIDTPTDDWGISVDRVEIKDIALPEGAPPAGGDALLRAGGRRHASTHRAGRVPSVAPPDPAAAAASPRSEPSTDGDGR